MCEAFKLDETPEAFGKLQWFLENGYTIVDRFPMSYGFIIIVKKT